MFDRESHIDSALPWPPEMEKVTDSAESPCPPRENVVWFMTHLMPPEEVRSERLWAGVARPE